MSDNKKSHFFPEESLKNFKFHENALSSFGELKIQEGLTFDIEESFTDINLSVLKEDEKKIEEILKNNNFQSIYSHLDTTSTKEENFTRSQEYRYLVNKKDKIFIEHRLFGKNSGYSLLTINGPHDKANTLFNLIKNQIKGFEKEEEGVVFAITTTPNGKLTISSFGQNGSKIERNNYNPEVIEGYDYVVEQLNAKEPDGRIVIFDGRPGTGKTFLVRSLLLDIEEASLIIVPANVVAQAGTPELLTCLVNHKENYDHKMILIVEDADQIVTKRAGDNISAVSTLLNLGDGILGSVLDIRVVCTTNATVKDLDEAITRPGRLCKHLSIPELNIEQVNKVYERLTGKPGKFERKLSLAEVYKLAKDSKFVLKSNNKKVGF